MIFIFKICMSTMGIGYKMAFGINSDILSPLKNCRYKSFVCYFPNGFMWVFQSNHF